MQEIELKILNINSDEVIKKLTKLGAIQESDELIDERYYDDGDAQISKKGNLLRLRKVGKKAEITYKDGRVKNKDFLVFEETESEVGNFEALDTILKKLALRIIIERQKKRTIFSLNAVKVEIHKYPIMPAWLELEGKKEDIESVLGKLRYNKSQTVTLTDSEIIQSYGLDYRNLKF